MSLLAKLRSPTATPAPPHPPPAPRAPQQPLGADERAWETTLAVAENLRVVLNTKRGYGYFLEDFGLGEYFQRAADQATPELVRELEANLARFEPRLGGARVELVGRDVLWLAFRVRGVVAGHARVIDLYFHTTFGSVRVEVVDG
jgi:type VI secretion system protein